MSEISRRKILAVGLPLTAIIASGAWVLLGNGANRKVSKQNPVLKASTQNTDGKKVVKITAQRFHYTPSEIILKKGEPVLLELTSLDRLHGFYIPDLNVRADIVPGRATHVPLTLDEIGEHDFLCDVFCGSGHGEMSGKIVVVA